MNILGNSGPRGSSRSLRCLGDFAQDSEGSRYQCGAHQRPDGHKATLTNVPMDTKAAFTDALMGIKGSTLILILVGPGGPWPSLIPLMDSYLYDTIKNPIIPFI